MLRAKFSGLFFWTCISLSLLLPRLGEADLSARQPATSTSAGAVVAGPQFNGVGIAKPATKADAEKLAAAINQYFLKQTENPGHSEAELNQVRQTLIALRARHVKLTLDPLLLSDKELSATLYDLIGHKQYAGPAVKASFIVHAAMVCMAFMVSCFSNGPGPEELDEPAIDFSHSARDPRAVLGGSR